MICSFYFSLWKSEIVNDKLHHANMFLFMLGLVQIGSFAVIEKKEHRKLLNFKGVDIDFPRKRHINLMIYSRMKLY